MVASLIVVPLVSLVSKKMDKQYVEKIFACFKKGEQELEGTASPELSEAATDAEITLEQEKVPVESGASK